MKTWNNEDKSIQIYNGDCLEVMDKLIEAGVKVDCVVTSPPYNIGKEYEKRVALEKYLEWQETVIERIDKITTDNATIIWNVGSFVDNVNGDVIPLALEFYPLFQKYGIKMRQNIIWRFESGLSAKHKLSGRYEDIMWMYKGSDKPIFNLEEIRVKEWATFDKRNNPNGKNPTNVWHFEPIKGNSKEKKGHPCQFPVAMIERVVKAFTKDNSLVLDCFMGSGSTGVACKHLDRRFIGIELDEKYFDIAVDRVGK